MRGPLCAAALLSCRGLLLPLLPLSRLWREGGGADGVASSRAERRQGQCEPACWLRRPAPARPGRKAVGGLHGQPGRLWAGSACLPSPAVS